MGGHLDPQFSDVYDNDDGLQKASSRSWYPCDTVSVTWTIVDDVVWIYTGFCFFCRLFSLSQDWYRALISSAENISEIISNPTMSRTACG